MGSSTASENVRATQGCESVSSYLHLMYSTVPCSPHRRQHYEPPLIDRIQQRDYHSHPPRGPPPSRDEFPQRPSPRDGRYDYPPPVGVRDYRRPPSPREYRDYGPPPGARVREYDDYRRGPPPPALERDRFAPPSDFRGRYPPPLDPPYRSYGAPPPPVYDRYERRPNEKYSSTYAQPPGPRPRTPPRAREDYDRIPTRYFVRLFFFNLACSFWSTEITLNIVVLRRRRVMRRSIHA